MDATTFPQAVDGMAVDLERAPLTDAMEACHGHLTDGFRQHFAEGIGPNGEVWPRRKDKATHPLLNLKGDLLRAAIGTGPGHVKRIGHREITTGVQKMDFGSLRGAFVHQYGAVIVPRVKKFLVFMVDGVLRFAKKVTIPARPFIGASSETIDNCREEISEAVLDKVFRR